jgi:hypothetical protein
MNKPFQKAPPPISYNEGARLSRAIHVLPFADQERFLKSYKAHLASPRFQWVQRRGRLIYLALDDPNTPEVYDFVMEHNAQRALAALTDCLRSERAAVKVLMPAPVREE